MTDSSFLRLLKRPSAALTCALLASSSLAIVSCKKDKPSASPQAEKGPPTLRIYALSGAAGAIEPCGCVKDMLGGIDHAAAFIAAERSKVPASLVLGAGPMFFENPQLEPGKNDQELLKAEAMAQSLKDLNLLAWAPAANDWASGVDGFSRLSKQSGAKALAANLKSSESVVASHVEKRGELSIGLIGISIPKNSTGQTPVETSPADSALIAELSKLKNTDIKIALISAPRGEALRLIETINQGTERLQVVILGKPFDQGENNDQPFTPEILDGTLVVQAPNHLQAISVIDLYVRDGTTRFLDGTGLAEQDRQVNLAGRIDELSRRIERWKTPGSQVNAADIKKKEQELLALKHEQQAFKVNVQPKEGSYFLYDLVFVREGLGQDPQVSSRLSAYYQRVNEHNKLAFADRKAPPVREGQAGYVGIEMCSNCHLEERAFWNTTGHAHAYATLETSHKEFNLDCVSCHVTGYEQPGGSTVTQVSDFKSVQCEVCHGPGSQHAADPSIEGTIKAEPSRSLCASACHHAPHVGPDWSVDVAWPQIIGKGHGQ